MAEARRAGAGRPSAPWWKGAVIYQVWPQSFMDSNGDGVGDLPGLAARLPHIAALGADAVWISPFYPSPMADFGYDVADHCDVDPAFGTLADFDALLARAHALGLRVILDMVWSHSSDRHPWFAESRASRTNPRADWYVWADARPDGSPPNNWQSVFGGPAWTWDARRGQYYFHNFLKAQPDLNLHHPAVRAAVLAIGRFWLARGVDGLRLDAITFALHDERLRNNPPAPVRPERPSRPFDFQTPRHTLSHPALPRLHAEIRGLLDSFPDRFALAEVVSPTPLSDMRRATAPGRLHSAYGFAFLRAPRLAPALVVEAMAGFPARSGVGWPSWAFSNHDAVRAVSRWAPPEARAPMARLLLALLVALRGTILLYQGEELGLPQAEVPFADLKDPEAIANWPLTLGRDGARTPMPWVAGAPHAGFTIGTPWLPIGEGHAALAADLQERDPESTLALARRLLALRRRHPALRLGRFVPLVADDTLLAFDRVRGRERLRCLFNLGEVPRRHALGTGAVLAAVNGAGPGFLPPRAALIAVAPGGEGRGEGAGKERRA
ncbi:MAG: alpha-glucosidase [Thermaurantiacus tibetensis]